MKKTVSVLLALLCLILCACTPTVTEMPSYYTATLNGETVDASPFIYYADFNNLFYSFWKSDMLSDTLPEIVYDATINNVVTYYIIKEEAAARSLSLTDDEQAEIEKEYKEYLSTRKNEYLSESAVREFLTIFYYQEQIKNSFEVSEEDVVSSFLDEYSRFRYCLISKYDEKGQLFDDKTLDEQQKKAYNIYASVGDGTLSMKSAVEQFSFDVSTLDMSDENAEEELEILTETGFLVNRDGFTDYSQYALSDEVVTVLQTADVGDIFLCEDDIGWWICEKLNALDLLEDKREVISYKLRTSLFSSWLDERKAKTEYSANQQMVDEMIYHRP